MKKQHPSADKQNKPQPTPKSSPDTAPEKVPDRDLTDDKQMTSGSEKSEQQSPHKKPYEQQNQGIDQNVIPEQSGRIPDETREEVEEKSKSIKP